MTAARLIGQSQSGVSEIVNGRPADGYQNRTGDRRATIGSFTSWSMSRLFVLGYGGARSWRGQPEVVPYEGIYEDVEPHLTVATRASEQTATAIEQELTEQLPISAELREAWLVAFESRWTLRRRFELGPGR